MSIIVAILFNYHVMRKEFAAMFQENEAASSRMWFRLEIDLERTVITSAIRYFPFFIIDMIGQWEIEDALLRAIAWNVRGGKFQRVSSPECAEYLIYWNYRWPAIINAKSNGCCIQA